MQSSVGIIGMGSVGSSVSMSIVQAGAVRELMVQDLRLAVAEREAMDLGHGAAYYRPASVRVASIAEMCAGTRAIVIAAGKGALPGGDGPAADGWDHARRAAAPRRVDRAV